MLFPAKVKRCAESLQALFSWHLLYLFADVYGILVLRFIPPILLKEPGLRLPASASALGAGLASCWPRPQQLLPVSATGGGRRRCTSSASGLTDSTRTVSPTKWKAPWERQLLGGFSFLVKPMESSHNPIFSICDSPQKSSAVQKVYRAGLVSKARLSTTSQSHSVRQLP